MLLTIIGCGDAFGSGGRFNTCFHLTTRHTSILIDCGATSLPPMKSLGIARNSIELILITHFHCDHFGGIPAFVLDAQFCAKRTSQLIIAGPRGLRDWFTRVMETAFPGSASAKRKFDVVLLELEPERQTEILEVRVTPYLVRHGNLDERYFCYRIASDDRILAYSGDTEWTDELIDAGWDVDLFIAEAYYFDKKIPFHMDYLTLKRHLPRIMPKRVLLTHMSDDMLSRSVQAPEMKAFDSLTLTV